MPTPEYVVVSTVSDAINSYTTRLLCSDSLSSTILDSVLTFESSSIVTLTDKFDPEPPIAFFIPDVYNVPVFIILTPVTSPRGRPRNFRELFWGFLGTFWGHFGGTFGEGF